MTEWQTRMALKWRENTFWYNWTSSLCKCIFVIRLKNCYSLKSYSGQSMNPGTNTSPTYESTSERSSRQSVKLSMPIISSEIKEVNHVSVAAKTCAFLDTILMALISSSLENVRFILAVKVKETHALLKSLAKIFEGCLRLDAAAINDISLLSPSLN